MLSDLVVDILLMDATVQYLSATTVYPASSAFVVRSPRPDSYVIHTENSFTPNSTIFYFTRRMFSLILF